MIEYIGIRMTDTLKQHAEKEAAALGISVSQYIRAILWRSVGSAECRNWVASLHLDKRADLIGENENEHRQAYKYDLL